VVWKRTFLLVIHSQRGPAVKMNPFYTKVKVLRLPFRILPFQYHLR
jgi:hypothetical protein